MTEQRQVMRARHFINMVIGAVIVLLSITCLLAQEQGKTPRTTSNAGDGQAVQKTEAAAGTVTEFTPGSTLILKGSSGPRRYRFGKTVTYVTRSGKVLDEAMARAKVKVGVPVHVHYTSTGDDMTVDRVIL